MSKKVFARSSYKVHVNTYSQRQHLTPCHICTLCLLRKKMKKMSGEVGALRMHQPPRGGWVLPPGTGKKVETDENGENAPLFEHKTPVSCVNKGEHPLHHPDSSEEGYRKRILCHELTNCQRKTLKRLHFVTKAPTAHQKLTLNRLKYAVAWTLILQTRHYKNQLFARFAQNNRENICTECKNVVPLHCQKERRWTTALEYLRLGKRIALTGESPYGGESKSRALAVVGVH